MNGPEHYVEAERVMELAHDNANQENWQLSDHQMKRAHVHAMLAVAAATALAGSNSIDGIIRGYGDDYDRT